MAFLARDTYVADGVTTIFPISWVNGWLDDSHVKVFINFEETTAFTLSKTPDQITLDVAPLVDTIVTIQRVTPKVMPGDFSKQVVIRHTNLQANFDITVLWAEEAADSEAELQSTTGALGTLVNRAEQAAVDSEQFSLDSEVTYQNTVIVKNETIGIYDDTVSVKNETIGVRDETTVIKGETQGILDEFTDKYYGALASEPTTAPSGVPSTEGDQYWNTTDGQMYVFTSGLWVPTASAISTIKDETTLTGVGGQTSFTLLYDIGYLEVYYNGVRLIPQLDFIATDGINATLTEPVTSDDDILTFVAFGSFDVNSPEDTRTLIDVYSKDETDNGRKNYLINGSFDIWQRGTYFTSNINEYTADRWVVRNGIGGTTVIDKADHPKTGAFMYMQCVGNTSYAALWQTIEVSSPRDVEDKPFTLSIETDFDSAAEMEVESYWVDSDTQAQRSAIVYSSVVNIGVGKEINSVSFSAPTITTPTGDLNLVVSIIFNRQSSLPDGVYRVFRVQLEEGSIATPFEYRPIGEELALCQRYYRKVDGSSISGNFITMYPPADNSTGRLCTIYHYGMRTPPTFTQIGGFGLTGSVLASSVADYTRISGTSPSVGDGSGLGGYILDAEL